VPLDYRASGADAGAELILNIAGARHVATADAEGAATFAGVAVARTGIVAVVLASCMQRLERELRVVPPWVSAGRHRGAGYFVARLRQARGSPLI